MDVPTVLGVYWRKASYSDFLIVFSIVLLILIIFSILKYLQKLKAVKINDYQLFLFKVKRLGLSNFQIKVLNNIIELLHLSKPSSILSDSKIFENSIGRFIDFLKTKDEHEDSIADMCRELSIIYEKLYHPAVFKKPLESIIDIELNHLIYFSDEKQDIYLGKISGKNLKEIEIVLFRQPRGLPRLVQGGAVKVYLWRVGDAEYIFDSVVRSRENNYVAIAIPEKFSRDKEFRHPFAGIILAAEIETIPLSPAEEAEVLRGTIYKINDYEAVIRLSHKIEFSASYIIRFELWEFNFIITGRPIANKIIEENNAIYYTFKFEEMTDVAKNILKKYLSEHL